MASNVFGNVISNETLRDLPEYKDKSIGPRERATEALRMRSAEGKDLKARNYVESLKKEWEKYVEYAKEKSSVHDKTCVLVLIYNATGDTLKYKDFDNYAGHIGRAPYPLRIANGQWGAFLHVKTLEGVEDCVDLEPYKGSTGKVWYHGKNESGDEIAFHLYWKHPGVNNLRSIEYFSWICKADPSTEVLKEFKSITAPSLKQTNPVCGIVYEGIMGMSVAPIYEVMLTLEHAG